MLRPRLAPLPLVVAALAIAALAIPPGSGAATNTASKAYVVESIIARVNSHIITNTDYQKAMQQLVSDSASQTPPMTAAQLAAAQKNMLRDLIDQQLLLQRANDLGYSAESQTVHELDQIRANMHLATMQDLRQAIEAQGENYEDFRQNLANGILTRMVIEQDVAPRIDIPPDAIQKYYNQHKAEFVTQAGVDLSEIFISTKGQKASAIPKLKTLADQIQVRAARGEDFSNLAKTYSNGSTASQGGEIGFFKKGTLAPQLEKVVLALPVDGVTPVIPTASGFLILKVNSIHQQGQESLAQARDQVEQKVYEKLLQPELQQYLANLRTQAYIQVAPGYVDTGAGKNAGVNLTHFERVLPQDLPKKTNKSSGSQSGFSTS